MTTISLTLTDRQYDGYVIAANGAGMTPQSLIEEFASQQGARYADDFRIGVITGAAFIARFTPSEYGAILTASETNEAVAGLIAELTASPNVALDDPRLVPGLALLVSEGLLDAARPAEILAYERPTPEVTE